MSRADLTWLRDLRNQLDAAANGWNQWVLGYNAARQRELLEQMGLSAPDWQIMTALLAGICGTLLLGLTGYVLWQRQAVDPAVRVWQRFVRKLAKHGVTWAPHEGPLAFAQRAQAALPAQADVIARIAQDYATVRYARQPAPGLLASLSRQVTAFRP